METQIKTPKIIQQHAIWSAGAGLIPIPLAGFVAVTAIQLDMLKQLSNIYEVDYSETNGKAWISALAGSSFARIGAEAVKMIPGVGSFVGGLTMSILSAGTTYAVGHVFDRHFSDGGTPEDFNAGDYKEFFKEKFAEGKEAAKKNVKKGGFEDLSQKLRSLQTMLDDGLITKEEFESLRKRDLGLE